MSAPVRLESEFFDDPAIDALATILGYSDRDTAGGKLARLFSWQTEKFTTERPTYAVPRATLIGIFGARGPEAMIEAGLATLQADGLYKIHGSDKPNGRTEGVTRINWLWLDRKKKSAAGLASAAARDAAGDPRTKGGQFGALPTAAEQPPNTAPTDTEQTTRQPPSSLVSGLRTNIQRSPATPAPSLFPDLLSPELPDPDLRAPPVPAKRDVVAELWAEQERLRRAALPSCRGQSLRPECRRAITALLGKHAFTEDDLRTSLAEYGREAMRTRSVEFLDGVTNWVAKNVTRTLGRIGTSSTSRAGPGVHTAASELAHLLDDIAADQAAERDQT